MKSKGNAAVVHQYWEQCWNLQNLDSLENTHHVSFAQNGVAIGISSFKESLESFFGSFPDIQVSIEDILIFRNHVLTRVIYRGTHEGTYEGINPTQKTICVSGLELFLILEGKILHHWHEMDHLQILRQIGATTITLTE